LLRAMPCVPVDCWVELARRLTARSRWPLSSLRPTGFWRRYEQTTKPTVCIKRRLRIASAYSRLHRPVCDGAHAVLHGGRRGDRPAGRGAVRGAGRVLWHCRGSGAPLAHAAAATTWD
jgi:hypothetical protein